MTVPTRDIEVKDVCILLCGRLRSLEWYRELQRQEALLCMRTREGTVRRILKALVEDLEEICPS